MATMIPRRPLGRSGFLVSEIGFGAWAIGDAWGERVPKAQAKEALHAAIDAGVNFIDTADVYGAGRSEEIIGAVLRDRPEEVVVATKMGRGPGWEPTYPAMEAAARAALKRLKRDALDLVQLHCVPTSLLRQKQVFDHLEQLRRDGLIRQYGVSVETIDEALYCLRETGSAALQVIFNALRQRMRDEVLPAAEAVGVGLIARVPLASGLLTGKFRADHCFDEADHRLFNADGQHFNVGETFGGLPFGAGVRLVDELRTMLEGETGGQPLATVALRWVLDQPQISTVIPGMKCPHQVESNLAAAALAPLPETTHRRLESFYRDRVDGQIRGAY